MNTTTAQLFTNALQQCGTFVDQCAAEESAIAIQQLLSYFKQAVEFLQNIFVVSTGIILVLVNEVGC